MDSLSVTRDASISMGTTLQPNQRHYSGLLLCTLTSLPIPIYQAMNSLLLSNHTESLLENENTLDCHIPKAVLRLLFISYVSRQSKTKAIFIGAISSSQENIRQSKAIYCCLLLWEKSANSFYF